MGFYLRKSVRLGPLRFNLSKSGIGVSAGIRGMRVGTGPRGNYIHIGRGGLYYRTTLPSPGMRKQGKSLPAPPQVSVPPTGTHGPMQQISSGGVSRMVDSTSAALIAELERKRKQMQFVPLVVAIAISVLVFLALAAPNAWVLSIVAILAVPAVIFTYYRDLLAKSVVMMYDLDDDAVAAYRKLHDTITRLSHCGGVWHVNARADVYDPKYHAGAGEIVTRKRIAVGEHDPPFVRTNVSITRIPVGQGTLYFFPDVLLFYSSRGIGAIGYDDLQVHYNSTRFIEDGAVPRDATIVDRTWRYVNKRGGPDRRFRDNRELPVCEYESLSLRSSSGLNEQLQVSRLGIGNDVKLAIDAMTSAIATARIHHTESSPDPIVAWQVAESPVSDRLMPDTPAPSIANPPDAESPASVRTFSSMNEIYEALFRLLCCVMAVDGRASSAEKSRIVELMHRAGADWDADSIKARVSKFIDDVPTQGFKAILADALSTVPSFAIIGRQDILLKSLDAIALADGIRSQREVALINRIRKMLSDNNHA